VDCPFLGYTIVLPSGDTLAAGTEDKSLLARVEMPPAFIVEIIHAPLRRSPTGDVAAAE